MHYDVVIVGASFSGLTLAHHLPLDTKVLLIDVKPSAGSSVESTGLITEHTRQEFSSFFPIDTYITNPISAICVVAPNYDDYFVSHTTTPWIYQTDTKQLVKALADTLSPNVTFLPKTAFVSVEDTPDGKKAVTIMTSGAKQVIETTFLVGADGGHSPVAKAIPELDTQDTFLFGYEEVHYGTILLGDIPAETIYHFWFGEFSLGYGGWLSPTYMDERPAFRIGLAKYPKDRGEARGLLKEFLRILQEKNIITLSENPEKPVYLFGSHIPIGGIVKSIAAKNTLLIGDAAGFCGAFAADGIKGSVISGKEAALLITKYLEAPFDTIAEELRTNMNKHHFLIDYYKRQVLYRWVWDQMKRDRTFFAMYTIIKKEKEHFLDQFCDSKEKKKSLSRTVLKVKYIPNLIWYSLCILWDMIVPKKGA